MYLNQDTGTLQHIFSIHIIIIYNPSPQVRQTFPHKKFYHINKQLPQKAKAIAYTSIGLLTVPKRKVKDLQSNNEFLLGCLSRTNSSLPLIAPTRKLNLPIIAPVWPLLLFGTHQILAANANMG